VYLPISSRPVKMSTSGNGRFAFAPASKAPAREPEMT